MKTLSRCIALVLGAGALMLMSGCAMEQIHQQTQQGYEQAITESTPDFKSVDHPKTGPIGSGPIISDLPYVSTTTIPHVSYPPVFDEHVSISKSGGEGIGALLATVSRLSNVTITADPDVLAGGVPSTGGSYTPAVSHGSSDATLNLPPAIIAGTSGTFDTTAQSINYSGDLRGLLNQIGGSINATWNYDKLTNTVRFYRFETRVFTLATSPLDASDSSSVGGSGSGQEIQGGSGQTMRISSADTTTKFAGNLAVWKSVGDAVSKMLSPNGKMTLSPATGSIVVRDTYSHVDEVADYLRQVNAKLSLAVMVNVRVYRIQVNNEDQHGISWNALYNSMGRLANRVGATLTMPAATMTGAGGFLVNAPTSISGGTCTAGDSTATPAVAPNVSGCSLWNSSSFFLQALSTLGKTSELQNANVDTSNNQPGSFKVVTSTSYLAETANLYTNGLGGSSSSVVGAGATLTPGSVETGFTLNVLPSVQQDGKHVLLQLTISNSTLDAMNTVTSGGSSIQTPNVSSRQTTQRAWLQSGQTLVLAGFDSHQNQSTTNTPFGESTWMFAGNRNLNHARNAIVIVVTPVVSNAAADIVMPNGNPSL